MTGTHDILKGMTLPEKNTSGANPPTTSRGNSLTERLITIYGTRDEPLKTMVPVNPWAKPWPTPQENHARWQNTTDVVLHPRNQATLEEVKKHAASLAEHENPGESIAVVIGGVVITSVMSGAFFATETPMAVRLLAGGFFGFAGLFLLLAGLAELHGWFSTRGDAKEFARISEFLRKEAISYGALPAPVAAVIRAALKNLPEEDTSRQQAQEKAYEFSRLYTKVNSGHVAATDFFENNRELVYDIVALAHAGGGIKPETQKRFEQTVCIESKNVAKGRLKPPAKPAVEPVKEKRVDITEVQAAHDIIIAAWADMITDPLNALTHSALFDVTQPRTADFVRAYAAAEDYREVMPADPAAEQVRKYRSLVKEADRAWVEAHRYAEHLSYSWLPDSEAKAARQAETLLKVAADETATLHERAAAAKKAASLLDRVKSFMLPDDAVKSVEKSTRLAITA